MSGKSSLARDSKCLFPLGSTYRTQWRESLLGTIRVLALNVLSSLPLSVCVWAFQSDCPQPLVEGLKGRREKERQLESALRTPQYREAESKGGGK